MGLPSLALDSLKGQIKFRQTNPDSPVKSGHSTMYIHCDDIFAVPWRIHICI